MAQPNRSGGTHTTHMWNIPYRPQQKQTDPTPVEAEAKADQGDGRLDQQVYELDEDEDDDDTEAQDTQDSLDTEDEGRPRNHIEIPKITPMNSATASGASTPGVDGSKTSSNTTLPARKEAIPQSKPPKQDQDHASRPAQQSDDPAVLAQGLEGRFVDEFGNVLDWDGTVLGRVEGDLPSMVGRAISTNGEVVGVDGEVAGHVSENYALQAERQKQRSPVQNGLVQDEDGNIYNAEGEVVGKMKKQAGDGRKVPAGAGIGSNNAAGSGTAQNSATTPSPSEIYLDVKSTHDGIQLIIKIPTVFNRDP